MLVHYRLETHIKNNILSLRSLLSFQSNKNLFLNKKLNCIFIFVQRFQIILNHLRSIVNICISLNYDWSEFNFFFHYISRMFKFMGFSISTKSGRLITNWMHFLIVFIVLKVFIMKTLEQFQICEGSIIGWCLDTNIISPSPIILKISKINETLQLSMMNII